MEIMKGLIIDIIKHILRLKLKKLITLNNPLTILSFFTNIISFIIIIYKIKYNKYSKNTEKTSLLYTNTKF